MIKAIYSSPFVPPEWIAAHGLEPRRIFPRLEKTTGLGGSNNGMCPFARGFIGEALSADEDAVVVMTTTCDQMRRAAGAMSLNGPGLRSSDRHFLMNVPATWQTASSLQLYIDELKRLGRFLKSCGGTEPSKQKLLEAMDEYDGRRRGVLDRKPLLSGRRYAEMLAAGNPSTETKKGNGKRHPSAIPLALLGGPLLWDDLYLLDLIEESGARIALDAMEYGERTLPRKFDRRTMNKNPLIELAGAYFGSIPDAFRRPNSALYLWLRERLEQEKVKGVIFHHYLWCDIWHAELGRFREWSDLPVLDINAGDDGQSVRSRMNNLIQTFIQVLK